MTTKTIKALCLVDGLPLVPELNDKLYLYEKGFRNILPLNLYENLISLWLNKNKIVKIENLEGLKNLMCLYLQDNLITKIEGLDFLS
jgi:dynein assembly factor 1